MENAVLIQNVTLADIERMINKAVERRMSEFYERIHDKPPVMVKRKDAAALLGVSLPTLDSYARIGIIHAHHIGGRVFFDDGDLQSVKGRRPLDKHLTVSEQEPFA